jgi:hypothetical protein
VEWKLKPLAKLLLACALSVSSAAFAQEQSGSGDSQADLAKKLSNPLATLISVPMQLNWDQNIGSADEGDKLTLNVQPVWPFSISEDWNLISRTILPIIDQNDIFPGAGDQFGLGDTVQSLFFSPKAPTSNGWIWGVGPVFLLPTGTDDLLSSEKWGAGPTGVALKQEGPWTYGALFNHIWSFAGDSNRSDVNSTYLQPFLAYNTPKAVTYAVNTESTYDWESSQWQVPVNFMVSKVTRFGGQLVSIQGGIRYYVESFDTGPDGFGLRFTFTLLFPR